MSIRGGQRGAIGYVAADQSDMIIFGLAELACPPFSIVFRRFNLLMASEGR
jgi:hypothetical protein